MPSQHIKDANIMASKLSSASLRVVTNNDREDSSSLSEIPQVTELISCKQLAHVLELHEFSVRRMVQQKRIPHYKIGSAVRFNLTEVLNHMRQPAKGGLS